MDPLYEKLVQRTQQIVQEHQLLNQKVQIKARGLSIQEAIGDPEGDDFPLQKGKEKLMQADFNGSLGQAFTDRYGHYEGSLHKILSMPLANNYRRALFVSTVNAVLRHLNLIEGTVHCRDQEPTKCSRELSQYIRTRYKRVKIGQVGFQPRMVEQLVSIFDYRILDLDKDNIGSTRYGIKIEGPENKEEVIAWADLLLVTGTTLVNGTIGQFLRVKPVLFYGTTIAGPAYLMGWERFCVCST